MSVAGKDDAPLPEEVGDDDDWEGLDALSGEPVCNLCADHPEQPSAGPAAWVKMNEWVFQDLWRAHGDLKQPVILETTCSGTGAGAFGLKVGI